jgi:hypothetical protein
LLGGNLAGADKVGSVHDMRFVFLDNDPRMLFATTFDGDWDAYIDDFIAKIPDYLTSSTRPGRLAGYPPSRRQGLPRQAPDHGGGRYVGSPNLTVADTRRLERVGQAVDEFLDKVGDE